MNPSFLRLPDGNRLAYHQNSGASPGVVFLGGFKSDMDGTKALHLERVFSERRRSYLRFDYTGHGRSSGRFEDGTIGRWAADAEHALIALTTGPQVLVGSSMGGWIALLLARRVPARIAGLVGIASAPDFTETIWNENLDEGQRALVEQKGRVELPSDYSEEPTVITERLIEDGRNNLVLNDGLRLEFPARFLQGTNDTDVDVSIALRILECATGPDIRLTVVKDADHRFSSEMCLDLIVDAVDSIPFEG